MPYSNGCRGFGGLGTTGEFTGIDDDQRAVAIKAAVELSQRYISGRYLPDKAIDVIDEACSRERLEKTTRPPDLTELEVDIDRLEGDKDDAVHSQDFELAASIRDKVERLKVNKEEEILKMVQEPPTRHQDGPNKKTIEHYENSPAQWLAGSLL